MKQVLFIFVLISSSVSFASGTLRPSNPLTSFGVDFNVINYNHTHLEDVDHAEVMVNAHTETITLTLFDNFECPQGQYCLAVARLPQTHTIILPLKEVSVESCGIIRYSAELDRTPLDGELQILEVFDNTQATCRMFFFNNYEAHYTSYNPWTQKETISSFFDTRVNPVTEAN